MKEVRDSAVMLKRRIFLQSLAAAPLISARADEQDAAPGSYVVGVGHSSDPYRATITAIQASAQFPAVSGRTVVIKPNLAVNQPSQTGITTDPQVVKAVVDVALKAGAASIGIAEGSCVFPAPFGPCGYATVFASYGPKVRLVDLTQVQVTQVNIAHGGVFRTIKLPQLLADPNIVFISAGKLKTHANAVVSLSMKNLVGMAPPSIYGVPGAYLRQDLHERGIDEAIIDFNLARPVHFAVIDGVWGMQGNGPTRGTAIEADLVFAGKNAMAVDRVALQAMGFSQASVPHLVYGAIYQLGPAGLGAIQVAGDAFTPLQFVPAITPPIVWRPTMDRTSISPGQQVTISYNVPKACSTRLEIIHDSDSDPAVQVVRQLQDWTAWPGGTGNVVWDGNDDRGRSVPAASYMPRVRARFGQNPEVANASTRLAVTS